MSDLKVQTARAFGRGYEACDVPGCRTIEPMPEFVWEPVRDRRRVNAFCGCRHLIACDPKDCVCGPATR
jgi:hypothetical protein